MPEKTLTPENLSVYLPDKALPVVSKWFENLPILVRLSRPRTGKLGDFMVSPPAMKPIISINSNLNAYEFAITLAHEYAHFIHWRENKWSRKPHGKKWKLIFGYLLLQLVGEDVFPQELLTPLNSFIDNPAASGNTHTGLTIALHKFNPESDLILLDKLPENSLFSVSGGRVFLKGEKQRKRYKCICKNNRKTYFVNAVIMVKPIYPANNSLF